MSADEPDPQGALVAAEAALDMEDIDRAEDAAKEALSRIRQLRAWQATGGDQS